VSRSDTRLEQQGVVQPEPESDADVCARLRQGDMEALGLLYDRHYLAILRFIQRVTQNAADSEDLAQEVFLVASRAARTFDPRASGRPWLFGMAARLLLRRNRRSVRFVQFLKRFEFHPRVPPVPSPHEAVFCRELYSEFEHALAKLSDEKRIVVILAEVEGLTNEEVARIVGIPLGTVFTRLHHARRALKQRLERRVA
jgi:RNA polymerase sigma factor (sigma-70 family)